MSVQSKVLSMLKSKEWVTSEELENLFPKKTDGHYSWPQRLRGLREPKNGGYTIIHRTKDGTNNLTEWHLERPEPPRPANEQALADNFHRQEEPINYREVKKQLCLF